MTCCFGHRSTFACAAIAFVFIIIGVGIQWILLSNQGQTDISEIVLKTASGSQMLSTLQIPNNLKENEKRPAVAVFHGMGSEKQALILYGIELARRGYIVLTVDAIGHGNSDLKDAGGDMGGIATLDYLRARSDVSTLATIGHSRGTRIIQRALLHNSERVEASVMVGGGFFGNDVTWTNATYPRNLLTCIGLWDELFTLDVLKQKLVSAFGLPITTKTVTADLLYGNFANGTARMLVLPPTNHLFEPADATIMTVTLNWLKDALGEQTTWISATDLVYQYFILGGVISTIGLMSSLWPLMRCLWSLFQWIWSRYRPNDDSKSGCQSLSSCSTKAFWGYGLLYTIVSLLTFVVFALIGFVIPWPQSFGGMIAFWFLGTSIVGSLLLWVVGWVWPRHKSKKHASDIVSLEAVGVKEKSEKFLSRWTAHDVAVLPAATTRIGKTGHAVGSVCVGVVLALWLAFAVWIVDSYLSLDYSFFLPFLNDLPIVRIPFLFLYLPFAVLFFMVEGYWVAGVLRTCTGREDLSLIRHFGWALPSALLRIAPFLLVILVQTVGSAAKGGPLIAGQLGFMFLFLFAFIFFFLYSTLFLAWSVRLTGTVYTGVVVVAVQFAWTIAAILPEA